MTPFVCDLPAQIFVSGPGVVGELAQRMDALGLERALVVCSNSVRRSALLARVLDVLGPRTAGRFEEVVQHSAVALVNQAAQQARDLGIDSLVAVGGGSSSDTAKAVAILLAEGGPLESHASTFVYPDQFFPKPLHRPKLPILAIPTTASAAEVTPGLGIRGAGSIKYLFWDTKLASRVVFLDEAANLEVPVAVMATTGMNGFAHCAEGLYSRLRNPVSSGLALQGARMFAQALPAMVAEPGEAKHRGQVLAAAALSGLVISNARVGIHHAVCHCLGARGGLPHGVANSIMLPHALAYNRDVAGAELAQLAEALGARPQPEAAIEAVLKLQEGAKVPRRLRDVGLDQALLPAIAEDTLHDRGLYFNPKRTTSAEPILAMLEAAW